jgi:hypothetical protein
LTAGIPAIAYDVTVSQPKPASRQAILAGERRTAHSAATRKSAKGDLVQAAAASRVPAAAHRSSVGLAPSAVNRKAARPPSPNAIARPSMWPVATISHSSSGLTDQSRWARSRMVGLSRSSRSSRSTTATKASATSSLSQRVISAIEWPPSRAASHSSAVAIGP